jgi:hypothetical protein
VVDHAGLIGSVNPARRAIASARIIVEYEMTIPKNIDRILMGIWFILFAVLTAPALGLHFGHSADVLAVLAAVVAIALFLRTQ